MKCNELCTINYASKTKIQGKIRKSIQVNKFFLRESSLSVFYFPAPQALPQAAGFGSGLGLPAPHAVPHAAVALEEFLLFQAARFLSAIVAPFED